MILTTIPTGEREREQGVTGDIASYTVGAFSSSRFIIAAMAMLTGEHEAVDLSLLLNEGVVGLAQTALRLAGLEDFLLAHTHFSSFILFLLYLVSLCLLSFSASVYRDERQEDEDGSTVSVAGNTQQPQLSGPEALARMKAGTRVVRGKDWKWGDQVFSYEKFSGLPEELISVYFLVHQLTDCIIFLTLCSTPALQKVKGWFYPYVVISVSFLKC